MTKAKSVLAMACLVAFCACSVAWAGQGAAVNIPSDAELMKQGAQWRDSFLAASRVTGSSNALDHASRAAHDAVPLNIPKELTQQSPLAKELAKETFGYASKKDVLTDSGKKGTTDLILFLSFSMPDDELAEYSRQAKEAGAVIVLRGMWQGSVTKTQQKAYQVNKPIAQWDINPGVFRKFKVDRVPAIILADAKQSQVLEDGCAQPGSYLRVDGTIAVRQALLLMRQQGEGSLAKEAADRLEKLESSK